MSDLTPLPEQAAFIGRPPSEHALLAAGPGTGKTWVLERRSEYLVDNGVEPDSIAVVTLTNAMVASLGERISHGHPSTIHSFALTHLNRLDGSWDKRIASPWEQSTVIPSDLKLGFEVSFEGASCGLREVRDFLTRMGESFKNDQSQPSDLSAIEQQLLQVLRSHQQLFGYALFDELVYDLTQLLELGEYLTDPPAVMLVDEYQDLTAGELRLLQNLSTSHAVTINACGDDRQSIYGFRSADPLALHRFADAYGLSGTDSLFRSRRLPLVMCELANAIASALPDLPGLTRHALQPWDEGADPGTVVVASAKSLKAEYVWLAKQVNAHLDAGKLPEEIMIVAATHQDAVLRELQKYAEPLIGVQLVSGRPTAPDPTQEQIVALAVRRLLAEPEHQMAWRLLAEVCSGLGDARLKKIFTASGANFSARVKAVSSADVTVKSVADAAAHIRDANAAGEPQTPEEIRNICRSVAAILGCEIDEARLLLAQPDEEPEEATAESQEDDAAEPAIEVHTIHSSKGLEAPVVFVVGAIEEAFTGRTDAGDGIRQLFVAATRASETLYISAPRSIRGTSLGAKVQKDWVRLADLVVNSARTTGIEISRID